MRTSKPVPRAYLQLDVPQDTGLLTWGYRLLPEIPSSPCGTLMDYSMSLGTSFYYTLHLQASFFFVKSVKEEACRTASSKKPPDYRCLEGSVYVCVLVCILQFCYSVWTQWGVSFLAICPRIGQHVCFISIWCLMMKVLQHTSFSYRVMHLKTLPA